MKTVSGKRILAFTLIAIAGHAIADVTLYGRLAVAAERDDFPTSTVVQPASNSVQDYGSYFGIRGTDEVYGQTAAIWQVEQFLDIASGQYYSNLRGAGNVPVYPGTAGSPRNYGGQILNNVNTLASSDSYLGLQGTWGRIRIGNLSNVFRSNTGAVDIFNGMEANVLGNYDRGLYVMPNSIRFDSPSFGNFSFTAMMSLGNNGAANVGGLTGINGNAQALNGAYDSPVYNFGLYYTPGNFSVTWNNTIWQNVGTYTVTGGNQMGELGNNNISPYNAYMSRLELGYNDPDGLVIGAGVQISQGFGWNMVPGFFGAQNVLWNPAAGAAPSNFSQTSNGQYAMTTQIVQTQEAGISLGWHLGQWTPKITYMYGNNWMQGANPWQLLTGTGSQIAGTGYQQGIAEIDWNITPRTIVFANYGIVSYGNTAQNIQFNGAQNATYSSSSTPAMMNNATAAIGFSHTF